MITQDYHAHTTYCDGSNTPEEMIQGAIDAGFTRIGFSGHAHASCDESYCMSEEGTKAYRQELMELREKYADRISICIGLEMDRYSDTDASAFDYTIGSVHYVCIPFQDGKALCPYAAYEGDPAAVLPAGCFLHEAGGRTEVYIPIDETGELLRAAAQAYYGGDLLSLAEHYFATVGEVAQATGCDIVGHFDLITKFNEPWIREGRSPCAAPKADAAGAAKEGDCAPEEKALRPLIDTEDPRYIAAWQKAADRLLTADIPFEINTGAMSKGYRSEPYPAKPIRDYIRERGGRFLLSSDSHRADTWGYGFARYESEVDPSGPAF